MNIWQELSKPIFVLAPMEDVSDSVFRQIVNFCAPPDVRYSEFINVEGMNSRGRDAIIHRLQFDKSEKPVIAQVWGTKPQDFYQAAGEIAAMGFDGIDINMGCPIKDVIKNGACAALMNNFPLAKEIILATKEGAGDVPVSVKTRIGFKSVQTEEWIGNLLSCDIAALVVHGRIAAEMSKSSARWDEIAKAVAIRDSMKKSTVIIGNGDVHSREDGVTKSRTYGVDGVMIGRAVFDNPWVFEKQKQEHTASELLQLMKRHVTLFESTWGRTKNYAVLKKFYKIYIKGFDGASDWRMKAMETNSPAEIYALIDTLNNSIN